MLSVYLHTCLFPLSRMPVTLRSSCELKLNLTLIQNGSFVPNAFNLLPSHGISCLRADMSGRDMEACLHGSSGSALAVAALAWDTLLPDSAGPLSSLKTSSDVQYSRKPFWQSLLFPSALSRYLHTHFPCSPPLVGPLIGVWGQIAKPAVGPAKV